MSTITVTESIKSIPAAAESGVHPVSAPCDQILRGAEHHAALAQAAERSPGRWSEAVLSEAADLEGLFQLDALEEQLDRLRDLRAPAAAAAPALPAFVTRYVRPTLLFELAMGLAEMCKAIDEDAREMFAVAVPQAHQQAGAARARALHQSAFDRLLREMRDALRAPVDSVADLRRHACRLARSADEILVAAQLISQSTHAQAEAKQLAEQIEEQVARLRIQSVLARMEMFNLTGEGI